MPVYFIRAGETGPVKIGWSHNPVARIRALDEGSPVPLRIIRLVDGDHQTERELHRRYRSLKLRREWFLYCPTMMGDLGLADLPLPILWESQRLPGKKRAADFIAYLDNGSPVLADRLADWIGSA
jgi:hypothetical protein